jgi:drug/metabolite transporter (DMT)-like permease
VNSCSPSDNRSIAADLALLVVTAIWGTTFAIVKKAIAEVPPFTFLAIRFTLAAVLLAVLYQRRLSRRVNVAAARAGATIGLFLFASYGFQTVGLQYTTPSKAGFITGLSVVMVPVLSAILLRRPPPRAAVAGVFLATVGLALLTLGAVSGPGGGAVAGPGAGTGNLLVLACALGFAMHIITIGKFSTAHDPAVLATIQIGVTAVGSAAFALVFEPRPGVISPASWWAIILTAVVATALAFMVQSSVQRFTSPTHTALVFSMEPVFAAAFSYIYLGEVMTGRGLAGGALVMAGMIVAEWRRREVRARAGQTGGTGSW